MTTEITRRQAMGALAAGTVGFAGIAPLTRAGVLDDHAIGYDASTGLYTLPDLPYSHDALTGVIDVMTMTVHHTKHHAGYVRGLNRAIEKLSQIRSGAEDASTIQHWQRQLSFHAGGHINHTLFWSSMAPKNAGGGGTPTGELASAIDRDFGSFDAFRTHFVAASASVEGSGWGWLVHEPISKKLMVVQMQNQQDMMFPGAVPLLGVDVWEHAYYLSYMNRRKDYIDSFMSIVNWSEVAKRYEAAIS